MPAPARPASSGGCLKAFLIVAGVFVLTCGGGCGLFLLTESAGEDAARSAVDKIGTPPGFTAQGATIVGGNQLCLDVCIGATRHYVGPHGGPDPRSSIKAWVGSQLTDVDESDCREESTRGTAIDLGPTPCTISGSLGERFVSVSLYGPSASVAGDDQWSVTVLARPKR